MPQINITRLIEDADPFDFSHSAAEGGKNAGAETWAAANAEAEARPLEIEDREGVRDFFRGFGAWSDDEIAAWSDAELDALVLQYASGDLRELQALCPGDGFAGIDWKEAKELSSAGTIGGNIFEADGALYIYLGD